MKQGTRPGPGLGARQIGLFAMAPFGFIVSPRFVEARSEPGQGPVKISTRVFSGSV